MIRFHLSPALGLALILAIASILSAAQPMLAIAPHSVANSLSQVRGDIASVWTNSQQFPTGISIASSQTGNPIHDALMLLRHL